MGVCLPRAGGCVFIWNGEIHLAIAQSVYHCTPTYPYKSGRRPWIERERGQLLTHKFVVVLHGFVFYMLALKLSKESEKTPLRFFPLTERKAYTRMGWESCAPLTLCVCLCWLPH